MTIKIRHMVQDDKQFLAMSIVAPLLLWWFFVGRNRYSSKGMTR